MKPKTTIDTVKGILSKSIVLSFLVFVVVSKVTAEIKGFSISESFARELRKGGIHPVEDEASLQGATEMFQITSVHGFRSPSMICIFKTPGGDEKGERYTMISVQQKVDDVGSYIMRRQYNMTKKEYMTLRSGLKSSGIATTRDIPLGEQAAVGGYSDMAGAVYEQFVEGKTLTRVRVQIGDNLAEGAYEKALELMRTAAIRLRARALRQ